MRWKPNLLQILMLLAGVIIVAIVWSERAPSRSNDRAIAINSPGAPTAGPTQTLARDERDLVARVIRKKSGLQSFRLVELEVEPDSIAGIAARKTGQAFYFLERDGTLRKAYPHNSEEIERVELGFNATSLGMTLRGLVMVVADREEIWTISHEDYRTLSRFHIPDLEYVATNPQHAFGIAVAGGKLDPSRRRMVLVHFVREVIRGSWDLRSSNWTIETSTGQRKLRAIDAVAIGMHGKSFYVLDGVDLWRLECCKNGALEARDFEPDVVEEPGGKLVTHKRIIVAFGKRGGQASTSGKRGLQVRGQDLAPFLSMDLPTQGDLVSVALASQANVFAMVEGYGLIEFVIEPTARRAGRSNSKRVPGRRASLGSASGEALEVIADADNGKWALIHTTRGLLVAN